VKEKEEYLFTEDIAQIFHISPNTIRRKKWQEKNGIPLKKVGRRLCGLRIDIEKWFRDLNG